VIAWLADGARSAVKSEDVLAELCARLVDCGLPLFRVAVFVRTLHPILFGRSFIWRPDRDVEVAAPPFDFIDDASFVASPVRRIYATGEAIRRRLIDPDCPDDFPFLAELRAEGVSDYLALPLHFTNGEIHVATFTTREACGFAPGHIAALEAIGAPLARVAEVRALRATAVSLLNAYVGHKAGEHILAGRIRRGDVEAIRAVIWLSDMRGFTRRADTMAPPSLIELLNLFFDNLVPAIEAEGGEVLKFMGDGLLAIFRIAENADADAACARALRAAKAAEKNVAALSGAEPGEAVEALRFAVALHVGEALYGNIGAGARLDFTCIGPSVNRAARLEKVASRLGRVIVASSAFARNLPDEFVALGDFELSGFREPETVFGLREEGV
jgi:adenylate cyclase